MAQEQMQTKPIPSQRVEPSSEQAQPVPRKKSKWWLWLILVLAVIGIAIYFLM